MYVRPLLGWDWPVRYQKKLSVVQEEIWLSTFGRCISWWILSFRLAILLEETSRYFLKSPCRTMEFSKPWATKMFRMLELPHNTGLFLSFGGAGVKGSTMGSEDGISLLPLFLVWMSTTYWTSSPPTFTSVCGSSSTRGCLWVLFFLVFILVGLTLGTADDECPSSTVPAPLLTSSSRLYGRVPTPCASHELETRSWTLHQWGLYVVIQA